MNYIDLLSHLEQCVCIYDHIDSDSIFVKNLSNFRELLIEIQDDYEDADVWGFCYLLGIQYPRGHNGVSRFEGIAEFLDKEMLDDC